jgi:prostaglandin-E synthase
VIPSSPIPHIAFPFHYITDVKDETINISDKELTFTGKSQGKDYEVKIEFFKTVDGKDSTYKVLPRSIQLHIIKGEEDQEEFWPRLLKDKALEKNQVKVDWDRYVDEDEEEEGFDTSALEGGQGMGGMPPGGGMSGMGGVGGPGGMGGMGGMGGPPGGGGGMPPGMDMEALMKQMGGMGGGAGGAGGMDMEAMMKQMGGMGGMGGPPGGEGDDDGDDDDDDDADDLPDLEEVN